ncbi:sulfurtransferase [Bacillus sp. DJP31]|uniref:sulfurtransferase n=1 Tax=Bacillus sp. DJP31 TaxID=3409789 RepID=UPI003BB5E9D9
MSHIKSFDWISEHINDENVRIVDCRFQLNDATAGEVAYRTVHLPNSAYMSLEKDLASPALHHGGRHPLPDIEILSEKLSSIGIDEKVTVVVYDDQNGAMASRLWWILRYLGHEKVFVMNGSYSTWEQKGFQVDSTIPTFQRRMFKPRIHSDMLVTVDEVRACLNNPNFTLIDSREAKRYKGLEEPIDSIAGHIPGALNLFWLDNSNHEGTWNEQKLQKKRLDHLPKDQSIIVYCGSGVTACPNVLALKEAGFKDVLLYAGSWSDWISYEDNPIAKE